MKRVLVGALLSLLASPALAQTSTAPGSLGGNQVGTGAVEPQGNAGGSGSGSASAAITSTPLTGPTASSATGTPTAGAGSAPAGGSTGSGSGGGGSGGGGHGGGMEALCLSAKGSVTNVDPDEFGLDCSQ